MIVQRKTLLGWVELHERLKTRPHDPHTVTIGLFATIALRLNTLQGRFLIIVHLSEMKKNGAQKELCPLIALSCTRGSNLRHVDMPPRETH